MNVESEKLKRCWKLYVDNRPIVTDATAQEAVSAFISMCLPEMKYMSFDALKAFIYNCIAILNESKACPRTVKAWTRSASYIFNGADASSERVILFLTNIVLACEGLGHLKGFGCGVFDKKKCKSMYMIDPERNSTR
jgi:hypothetical protein